MFYRIVFVCFLLMRCITPALADNWNYNAFVSQTLIYTSDNNYFGPSDDALNDQFRELALIINGTPLKSLTLSAQLLSRKAGSADDGIPRIDYGFMTWHFDESMIHQQSLRAGRIKIPFGFFNETRESPFGRQCIFLPQSIYTDRGRNSIMLADELLYSGEVSSGDWLGTIKAGYGRSVPDRKELFDLFGAKVTFKEYQFNPATTWNFQAAADYEAGRFRFAFSRQVTPTDFKGTIEINPLMQFKLETLALAYMSIFSFEWNEKYFTFTSELSRTNVNYGGITPIPSAPDYREYPAGGYVQLKLHISPTVDFFGRDEQIFYNSKDKLGKYYASKTGEDTITRFAFDRAYGIEYHPSSAWLLMAEVHFVQGTNWLTYRDMPENYVAHRNWNMGVVTAAWRF